MELADSWFLHLFLDSTVCANSINASLACDGANVSKEDTAFSMYEVANSRVRIRPLLFATNSRAYFVCLC